MIPISVAVKDVMKTCLQNPPRKMQSMEYDGPITLSNYQKFMCMRE